MKHAHKAKFKAFNYTLVEKVYTFCYASRIHSKSVYS